MTRLGETLRAYQARDPAARSRLEIFLLYPGVHAILFHRVSHWLWTHGLRIPSGETVDEVRTPSSQFTIPLPCPAPPMSYLRRRTP